MGTIWDSNMRTCDEIGMYLSDLEMAALTVFICFALYYAFKRKIYDFMKLLIILCLIADIGTAFLATGLALETDSIYHEDHKYFVARMIGWNTLIFNLPTNLMHWLFAFKYWVISVEVPRVLAGEVSKDDQKKRERIYLTFNIFMCLVNVVFCVWISIARYQLSIQSAGQPAPVSTVNKVSDLYHVVTGLILVAAIFFADSLRRIKKSVAKNPEMVANETTMKLHLTILLLHTVTFTIAATLVFRAFKNPTTLML